MLWEYVAVALELSPVSFVLEVVDLAIDTCGLVNITRCIC